MMERDAGKAEDMAALNIKNEEAYRLVKELAELEGESMTTVIIEAVKDRLEQKRKPQINEERMQHILELGRRVRQEADPVWIDRDQIADLYDPESGLPK